MLQLVSHSKVLAEMVNLHFLSLMEALMECHSTILVKLMPLWTPVLFAYQVSAIGVLSLNSDKHLIFGQLQAETKTQF